MADVEHSALTGSDLHEPKGAAAAAANQLYVADGAASGAWTTTNNINRIVLTDQIDDISSATAAANTTYIACPIAGDIVSIHTVLHTVITTGDAVITVSIGATAVTGGSLTIANSGSAVGDIDSATPTALKTVGKGDYIKVSSDGGSSVAAQLGISIVIDTS